MRSFTIRLAVMLLTFLLGITATVMLLTQRKQELRRVIPERWASYSFKWIDERTDAANLPKLRTILLPDDDLEVRVWVGFGIEGEDALILRRSAGQWSALHLHGMYKQYPPKKYQETFPMPAPKSGWERAWQKLVGEGLLTLPEASEVQCEGRTLDGTSYGVEVNMDRTYRIYSYDNPNHAKCSQAKQMLKIGEIIAEEFGLEEFKITE